MSRRRKQKREPNGYSPAVLRALEEAKARGELKPGEVYELRVRHRNGCALLDGKGPCDCTPDVLPPERVPSPQEK
jgi:hypothetical protein